MRKLKKTITVFNKLAYYYAKHRIYFQDNVCKMMDDAMKTLKTSLIDFEVAYQHGMQSIERYTPDKTGLWRSAWKNIEENRNQ